MTPSWWNLYPSSQVPFPLSRWLLPAISPRDLPFQSPCSSSLLPSHSSLPRNSQNRKGCPAENSPSRLPSHLPNSQLNRNKEWAVLDLPKIKVRRVSAAVSGQRGHWVRKGGMECRTQGRWATLPGSQPPMLPGLESLHGLSESQPS